MAAPTAKCPVSLSGDMIRLDFPASFTDSEFEMFCNAFIFIFMPHPERRVFYDQILTNVPNTPERYAALTFMRDAMGPLEEDKRVRCIVINLIDFTSDGNPARVALLGSKLLPYIKRFPQIAQGTGIATRNESIIKHAHHIASLIKTNMSALFVTTSVKEAEARARAYVAKYIADKAEEEASGRVSLRR